MGGSGGWLTGMVRDDMVGALSFARLNLLSSYTREKHVWIVLLRRNENHGNVFRYSCRQVLYVL